MASEHEAVGKLRRFKDEIENLMAAVEKREDKQQLWVTLKDLKGRMKSESKRCDTKRAQKDMDRIERDFYSPAIGEAWAAISSAKVNTAHSSWHEALYDARFQLEYYLQQLDD